MQNVERNAIEPVKQAVPDGSMTISTANEIAKLDDDAQAEILESGEEIRHKDVKAQAAEAKPAKEEVDTYINISDNDEPDEPKDSEEVDTYINISDDDEPDEPEDSDTESAAFLTDKSTAEVIRSALFEIESLEKMDFMLPYCREVIQRFRKQLDSKS